MVNRIIWSLKAKEDRKEILEYWIKVTGSKRYSFILRNEFNYLIRILLNFPNLGIKVQNYDARCLVKGEYKIFYDTKEDKDNMEIRIHHIWDTRRNPENMIEGI
jgi:toxin YoeB